MRRLEERHLGELTFSEVSRALRALSSAYVERRGRLREGAALSGTGKRAAFALFYGPLHYLLVREIVTRLPGAVDRVSTLVDLGCGTGAAGAGWAAVCRSCPRIIALDRHPWAIDEAVETYRAFGCRAQVGRSDLATWRLPAGSGETAFLSAFTLNELTESTRENLTTRLIERVGRGGRVLIVEPLAGFVAPWWKMTAERALALGGRSDEWRFRVELPAIVSKLDRAAGLDHRELTGRSLWMDGTRKSG